MLIIKIIAFGLLGLYAFYRYSIWKYPFPDLQAMALLCKKLKKIGIDPSQIQKACLHDISRACFNEALFRAQDKEESYKSFISDEIDKAVTEIKNSNEQNYSGNKGVYFEILIEHGQISDTV